MLMRMFIFMCELPKKIIYFILNKSCDESPKKIIHFSHPRHPLLLVATNPYDQHGGWARCDCCKRLINGFSYHCSICKFDLDLKCASLQPFIEFEGHKHSFLLLKPTSFSCDACGEQSDGLSYLCTTCQLQVHKTCSSWPLTVKLIGHSHQLGLTYSIQSDNSIKYLCKICYHEVNTKFWFYYCESCTYIVHLNCTSEDIIGMFVLEDVNQESNRILIPAPNETSVGLITQHEKHIKVEENQIATVIQHVSHEHCLSLSNNELKNDEICDGCARHISSPFYSCVNQCNFFLHKQCAELPKRILYPLHRHILTLLVEAPQHHLGLFKCRACDLYSNGFTYMCDKCNFLLGVGCSLISDTLRHEGHQHILGLTNESVKNDCNACGSDCDAKFRCEICDFNLDFQCASLPNTVKHRCPTHSWDMHPFRLTFKSVEDESGDYYCDICEGRRHQNHWFYHCEDCDYFAHPKCVLGEYLIKFGKTYELNRHRHPLTLVKKTKGQPTCAKCYYPCEDLVLVCAQCNLYFHEWCSTD